MKPRSVLQWGVTVGEAEGRSQRWEDYHLSFHIPRSMWARQNMLMDLISMTPRMQATSSLSTKTFLRCLCCDHAQGIITLETVTRTIAFLRNLVNVPNGNKMQRWDECLGVQLWVTDWVRPLWMENLQAFIFHVSKWSGSSSWKK